MCIGSRWDEGGGNHNSLQSTHGEKATGTIQGESYMTKKGAFEVQSNSQISQP